MGQGQGQGDTYLPSRNWTAALTRRRHDRHNRRLHSSPVTHQGSPVGCPSRSIYLTRPAAHNHELRSVIHHNASLQLLILRTRMNSTVTPKQKDSSSRRKAIIEDAFWTDCGRELEAFAAATGNARHLTDMNETIIYQSILTFVVCTVLSQTTMYNIIIWRWMSLLYRFWDIQRQIMACPTSLLGVIHYI